MKDAKETNGQPKLVYHVTALVLPAQTVDIAHENKTLSQIDILDMAFGLGNQ